MRIESKVSTCRLYQRKPKRLLFRLFANILAALKGVQLHFKLHYRGDSWPNKCITKSYCCVSKWKFKIKQALQQTLQQKMFITTKKIVAITSKSLQQFMRSVAIKFEVISLCYKKNFVAINLKYFNENFDVIIYLLLQ